jgi:MutS domain III
VVCPPAWLATHAFCPSDFSAWIIRPLCDPASISDRQAAVDELLRPELNSDVDAFAKQMKEFRSRDVTVLLSSLNRLAFRAKFPDDPLNPSPPKSSASGDDESAVASTMTPAQALQALKAMVNAVQTLRAAIECIQSEAGRQLAVTCRSSLLLAALRPERPRQGRNGSIIRPSYADIDGYLVQFEGILSSESVKETLRVAKGNGSVPEGTSLLLPPPGVDPAFDEVSSFMSSFIPVSCNDSSAWSRGQAQLHVAMAEAALAKYIETERRVTFKGLPGTDAVKIAKVGASAKRVIEVPVPLAAKVAIPHGYAIASQTNSVRRYTTPELTELARQLATATASLREAESCAVVRLVKRFLEVGSVQ